MITLDDIRQPIADRMVEFLKRSNELLTMMIEK
jgi:hypothetical protein